MLQEKRQNIARKHLNSPFCNARRPVFVHCDFSFQPLREFVKNAFSHNDVTPPLSCFQVGPNAVKVKFVINAACSTNQ